MFGFLIIILCLVGVMLTGERSNGLKALIGFLIFIVASGIISGVHAWRQFPRDSIWIKLVRVWVAIIFAPFYIFYISLDF